LKKSDDFIFGIRSLIEAINAGKEIDRVLLTKKPDSIIMQELFPLIREYQIPFQYVPLEKLNRISRKNHQGVIAYLSEVSYSPLEEIITSAFEKGEDPRIIILDQVNDVRNFGAIARSVECLGFTAIVIPERGAARINADAVKTSAGALMNIPVCRQRSLEAAVDYLKQSGLNIIAVTEKAVTPVYEENLIGPIALIMGGEETGISSQLLKKADKLVLIPMKGKTQSLNVSVATSVIMYEVIRQQYVYLNQR
jgi:23S rRNA (guanosine2251-2'-O)-methyltransferase